MFRRRAVPVEFRRLCRDCRGRLPLGPLHRLSFALLCILVGVAAGALGAGVVCLVEWLR